MPTHAAERGQASLPRAAKGVAARASAIARLELRLALVELKQKLSGLGIGAGLAGGAAVIGLFALAFALASITAGISTALPAWGALLIVTGLLLALTAGLLVLALRSLRRGLPPIPEQAIEEARLTTQTLGKNGEHRTG